MEAIVVDIPEGDRYGEVPCWVRVETAGGPCKKPSVVRVYGLPFCEAHGEEAKSGDLEELYVGAVFALENMEGTFTRAINPKVLNALRAARLELGTIGNDMDTDIEALTTAYPFREDLMDEAFKDFDYAQTGPAPEDWSRRQRLVIHKLMRMAFEEEEEADYLLADLEKHREHVAAQLAYVLEDYERRYGGSGRAAREEAAKG
jgi:hypothetical protein